MQTPRFFPPPQWPRPRAVYGNRATTLPLCLVLLAALASCDEEAPTDAAEPVSPSLDETALASTEGVSVLAISLPVDQSVATTAPNPAFRINQTGTGPNGIFQISRATSTQPALQAVTNGLGRAGSFRVLNSGSIEAALRVRTNGRGPAFEALTDGSGQAVVGTGTGGKSVAGVFRLTRPSNGNTALIASTAGTGYAAVFTAGDLGDDHETLRVISSMDNAARFFGDVKVEGTLTKTAGSFRIDHPLDPERKYLSHSFIESPDMMNVYNGNVTLDVSGRATVELPEYFEALNRDFRYQLTAIGSPGPNLYIAEGVKQNHFRIAGGRPYAHVSWQVTGVRQDAYANEHRIKVEGEKPPAERGLIARR